jgi:crotonobetainyl-CoA:carnitine CoA-transferase CaiB-like acyl-CoA transferase
LFSKTPSGLRRHAHVFGQHTDEVLAEVLDLPPERIGELRQAGTVR